MVNRGDCFFSVLLTPCTSTRRTLVLESAILRIHFGFGVVEAGAFYVEHVPAARAVVLLSFEVGCNAPIVFVRILCTKSRIQRCKKAHRLVFKSPILEA